MRTASLGLAALLFLGAPSLRADDVQLPDRLEVEDALPEGASMTGREIWDRFLENRMHSAVQHQRVISRDPGGGEQTTRFWVRWRDFRDENKDPVNGVIAKGLMRFRDPADMRDTAFLLVVNEGRPSDQFVYSPATRKVRRVNLRGVGVMGTDYTFDDIAFRDVEDADYVRQTDEIHDGVPVYVVRATLKPFVDSKYKTAIAYVEKEHYVALRAVYIDENGVSIREARATHSSIREFDGVWVPTESTMLNLKEKTSTKMFVEELDANPEIGEQLFSTFRLALRR